MPYNYANGTQSEVPPFMAIEVFPKGEGYLYSKLALDMVIEIYCGKFPMQVQAAKWRIFAILNNEYKSLNFMRQMLVLADRTSGDSWDRVINKMVAIDELSREYAKELLGREL